MKEISKKIYLSKWFIPSIIILGIAIRLRQYLFDRSLWVDEANLALNIIKYNYLDLLKPLNYNAAAPPLFLLITKLFTKIFGYREYVLRFLPLIAGIATLFLFWYLAGKLLHKYFVPIAIGLLAFSRYAIYDSNEFKQYSIDLMVTIIILIIAVNVYEKNFNLKSNLLLGFSGAFLIWLSYPSIFILAGISVSLLLILFIKERKSVDKKKYLYIILMSAIWLVSFAVSYLLIIRVTADPHFFEHWKIAFAPIITSAKDLLWYSKTFLGLMEDPIYLYFPSITLLLIFAGFAGFYRKKDKMFFSFIFFSLLILFIASLLKIYPIFGRLVIFTLPIIYLLVAMGLEEFFFNISKKSITVTLILILLLFYQPLFFSAKICFQPIVKEETRPLIEYYQKNKSPEDKIYVYGKTETVFLYYTRDTNEEFKTIESETVTKLNGLDSLVGEGRVWFIFSHIPDSDRIKFIEKLDHLGHRLNFKYLTGASLYLYDL